MQPTHIDKNHFELLKEGLRAKSTWPVKIISDSMEPLIKTGEEVEVIPAPENLQRFDILVFWSESKLICHYLWSRNQLKFNHADQLLVTRPLKYRGEDFPISPHHVLGVVKHRRLNLWQKIKAYLKN